jgi:hypothetical protein
MGGGILSIEVWLLVKILDFGERRFITFMTGLGLTG